MRMNFYDKMMMRSKKEKTKGSVIEWKADLILEVGSWMKKTKNKAVSGGRGSTLSCTQLAADSERRSVT